MPEGRDVTSRLALFKADLKVKSAQEVVRRHISFGDCFALDEEQHFQLKSAVASQFDLNPVDVFIVGSAKLGFSIAPSKRYRHFGNYSDIDIAVVSDRLFDRVWEEAYEYARKGGYWEAQRQFERYFFKGWIRPDMLPSSPIFGFSNAWWEFFRTLTASHNFGPFRIRAGIYRGNRFLEGYQEKAVSACKEELE